MCLLFFSPFSLRQVECLRLFAKESCGDSDGAGGGFEHDDWPSKLYFFFNTTLMKKRKIKAAVYYTDKTFLDLCIRECSGHSD